MLYILKFLILCGFRPAINNVLDASTRTLVIVFSQRSSMKQYFPIFLQQLNTTVNRLINDGGPFDKFIFVGFIRHYDGTSSFSTASLLTYANFYGFLKNIDFFDGDIVQPAMAAIERAQQLFPLGFSLVWVFTDTPDSDANAESLSFVDNNLEQRIIQIGLAWRSKLSLVVLQNDSSPIKSDGDKFDVYRRITKATHGDLIVCNSTELSNVLAIFTLHVMPENLAVFYGITNKRNITFTPQRDFENQYVWILVTLDVNSEPKLPYYFNGKGIIVAPAAFGNFFVLYLSSESGPNRLESFDGTIFNARVFASSHQTTLFSFVQDELADFGYFYMQSDMFQMAVASPIGFPSLPIGMAYRLLTSSGNILSNYLRPFIRDPEATTFAFVFEPITDCPPDLEAATISCPKQNLAALGDPRLHSFRQLIFIFEQSTQIKDCASIIGDFMYQIVQSVSSSIQNVQYSLLSFDSDNVRVLMSTYDGDFFHRTFCSVITNLTFYPNSSGRPLRVQDAVDSANKELLYLQRQSSGRYRPIRTEATPTLFRASAYDMLATQLIYDYRVKLPTAQLQGNGL
ncbi:hypothetical protein WR25_07237 [Diploscapter pachys]|uniref:VWFA domain-containing protein n=1 Tax=Diploscapter pachys TaxID=2018661 RepID=A0A2A2L5Q8_9BILA|nr:hypothetical protein WR25_07237 [Diploscapter pachys]